MLPCMSEESQTGTETVVRTGPDAPQPNGPTEIEVRNESR